MSQASVSASASVPACPACAAPVGAGDRYCEACGGDLPLSAAPAAPAAPATVPTPCPSCGSLDALDGYCAQCGVRLPTPGDHREIELAGAAGVTDRGRRPLNEDAMAVLVRPGVVAAVVCDGVSATPGSDRVAQAAVDAAASALAEGHGGDPALVHLTAYQAARAAALAVPVPTTPQGPPSCTYLAATVTDAAVHLSSLGDCRGYWLADGAAEQLTKDDSWATEEVDGGRLSAEQAYADRRAHSITRWIGADADPAWEPALTTFAPPGAGRVLLCSDGVWNYALDPAVLAEQAAPGGTAIELARRLVRFADEAGGADNITAVVVDLPLLPPEGGAPS